MENEPTNEQKQGWEEGFDKEFVDLEGKENPADEYWNVVTNDYKIKSFISQVRQEAVEAERERLRREINKRIEAEEGKIDYSAGKISAFDEVNNLLNKHE